MEQKSEGRVVFLHGFTQDEIRKILSAVKLAFDTPQDIAFCMSTPNNLNWKVKDLINDVREDHEYLKKNPPKINPDSQHKA